MFVGIIIIAVLHSILLVPALLGEFKFLYKGIPHSNMKKSYAAVDSTSYITDTEITIVPLKGVSDKHDEFDDELENDGFTTLATIPSDGISDNNGTLKYSVSI